MTNYSVLIILLFGKQWAVRNLKGTISLFFSISYWLWIKKVVKEAYDSTYNDALNDG